MKRLIVNADDFGYTRGVNEGIIRAFKTGIVTSTTIMANGDAFEDAVALTRASPGLGVGCHLSIVGGRPVSEASKVRSLLDDQSALPATLTKLLAKLAFGSISTEEIAFEFCSQLQLITDAGIRPTHLDTHKHSHTHPQVMKAVAMAAADFGIKCIRNPFETFFAAPQLSPISLKQYALAAAIRSRAGQFRRIARAHNLKTPDRFFGVGLTGMLDSTAIRSMMESLKDGSAELMCHPGMYDAELESARTRLKRERERELEALADPSLRLLARERGIELINYGEL